MSTWIESWIFLPRVFKVRFSCGSELWALVLTWVVYEDPEDRIDRVTELESQNEQLRRRLDALEREINSKSPSRSAKKPPQLSTPRKTFSSGDDELGTTLFKLNVMSLTPREPKMSPVGKKTAKMRKLTARNWDLMDENELDAYT